jgi:hypothetical protein
MQLPLAGNDGIHAALKARRVVLSRVDMSNKQSDLVVLDHAYDNGKLVGFWGLETADACPFTGDQPGPRIAWLDGFADGAWKRASKINTSRRSRKTARPEWNVLTPTP